MPRTQSLCLPILASCLVGASAAAQTVAVAGFELTAWADLNGSGPVGSGPTALAFGGGATTGFGTDLYVTNALFDEGEPSGSAPNDLVLRLDSSGSAATFAVLAPEADPVSLELAPLAGSFGENLYLSANNRDFGRTGDCGGVIQRVDAAGGVADFTVGLSAEACASGGLQQVFTEPRSMAFSSGGGFGEAIFVGNSSNPPFDIGEVDAAGNVSPFVDDGLGSFVSSFVGLTATDLEFGPGGGFGTDLYFTDQGDGCACIRIVDSTGSVGAPWVSFAAMPVAMRFAPEGPFGNHLYVTLANGEIHRVDALGSSSLFASGFTFGTLEMDALEFSPSGNALYVADHAARTVYRIRLPLVATAWEQAFAIQADDGSIHPALLVDSSLGTGSVTNVTQTSVTLTYDGIDPNSNLQIALAAYDAPFYPPDPIDVLSPSRIEVVMAQNGTMFTLGIDFASTTGEVLDPGSIVGFNPQPEPPDGTIYGFNPQPEPPALGDGLGIFIPLSGGTGAPGSTQISLTIEVLDGSFTPLPLDLVTLLTVPVLGGWGAGLLAVCLFGLGLRSVSRRGTAPGRR